MPTAAERLEAIKRKQAQLKAEAQKIRSREAAKKRKLDTRRKIVLGGALLAAAKTNVANAALVEDLIAGMNERDRALFD